MSEVSDIDPPSPISARDVIESELKRDLLAADFLTSLFWSALYSYRYDSILRPFPPNFVEEGNEEKKIDDLRSAFKSLPSLDKLLDRRTLLNQSSTELLQWMLQPKGFTVNYRPPSTLDHILKKSSSESHTPQTKPQFIFELVYSEENESKFQSVVGTHGVLYAYHGSSVENFYSIVHNGLLNMFNKVSAFGEGTYLSSELSVCLNWSPSGSLWPSSVLPHLVSCVAVCELTRHPSVMSRSATRGSEPNLQNSVPDEYFIVSNDELVRVKYLLLYRREPENVPRRPNWLYQNKFIVVIAIYVLSLLVIGVLRSNQFKRLYRKYFPGI